MRTNIAISAGVPKQLSDAIFDGLGAQYPLRRVAEGIDIANTILYLASDQASFITGSNVVADGGALAASVRVDPVTQHMPNAK